MLRLALSLLVKKKLPPPLKRGRVAASVQRKSKSVSKGRPPSPAKSTTARRPGRPPSVQRQAVKAPGSRAGATRNSKMATRAESAPVTENVEQPPVVSASLTVASPVSSLVVGKKSQYSLATAVSTVVVPPSANAVLEAMKQTLSPAVRAPSEALVDLSAGGSGADQGGEAVSQMEEFYTPKRVPLFATAMIAGTNAVKQSSQLIPFCHPARIQKCSFTFRRRVIGGLARSSSLPHRVVLRKRASQPSAPTPPYRGRSESSVIYCFCTVATEETRSGVETEALAGATVAAVTLYDMLRGLPSAQEDGLSVGEAFVLTKRGHQGDFTKLLVSELPTEDPADVRRAALTAGEASQAAGTTEESRVDDADDCEDLNSLENMESDTEKGATQAQTSRSHGEGYQTEVTRGETYANDNPRRERQRSHTAEENDVDTEKTEDPVEEWEEKEDAASPAEAGGGAWWKSTGRERRLQHSHPHGRPEGNHDNPDRKLHEAKPPLHKETAGRPIMKNRIPEQAQAKPKIVHVGKRPVKIVVKSSDASSSRNQEAVEEDYFDLEDEADAGQAGEEERRRFDDEGSFSNIDKRYGDRYKGGAVHGNMERDDDGRSNRNVLRYNRDAELDRSHIPQRDRLRNIKESEFHESDELDDINYDDVFVEEDIPPDSRQRIKKDRVAAPGLSRRGHAKTGYDHHDDDNDTVATAKGDSWDSEVNAWEDDYDWEDRKAYEEEKDQRASKKRPQPLAPQPKKPVAKLKKNISARRRLDR